VIGMASARVVLTPETGSYQTLLWS